ncbi:m7GpppX diphosphatase [Monosporozyma servazzii]
MSSETTNNGMKELITRFKYRRVLNSNPQTKVISLLGLIDGKDAILTVEKTHFMFEDNIKSQQQRDVGDCTTQARVKQGSPAPLVYNCESEFSCVHGLEEVKQITANDIYYWGVGIIKEDLDRNPTARVNLIWPANYVHIKRFEQQNLHFVTETPKMYNDIVKPYIDEQCSGNNLQWVYKILYEGSDAERVVYKDDADKTKGFLILPDTRWDGINIESMYLVALAYRDDIKSLRDLKPIHRDWLIELNRKIRSIVPACFNHMVRADELRIFIHYQPSYYHFHLHIINIKFPAGNEGLTVGKAVLLEDAIETLGHIGPEGYMERSLSYSISDTHELWRRGLETANLEEFDKAGIPRQPDIRNAD